MTLKHPIIGLVMVLGAVSLAACEQASHNDAVVEQNLAADKIAKAENEAADKTTKAKRDAEEKIASVAKDLAETKAEVKKDLAVELADIKYHAFVGLSEYKALVTTRLDEHEKKLTELKVKGDGMAGAMNVDAKKSWSDALNVAEAELKLARADLKSLDTATEPTWTAVKTKIDADVKNFAKSVDTLGKKLEQKT